MSTRMPTRRAAGGTLTVYLDNGYWFTLSGTKADEVVHLIKTRMCMHFKGGDH